MKVKDIEISKIKSLGNVRQRLETKDVHELMDSIKQDGILEPIGVLPNKHGYELIYGNRRVEACKKLGWTYIPAIIHEDIDSKDIIIKNTVENIQREDVSVLEQGRIFIILKNKYNMTGSEIASRFGLSNSYVLRAINVFETLPKEMAEKVQKFSTHGTKKGKVPVTTADKIIKKAKRYGLGKTKIQALIRMANKDWFTIEHIDSVFFFIGKGFDMEESFKLARKYSFISVKVPLDLKELEKKMMKHKIYYKKRFIRAILAGEIKETLKIPKWVDDGKEEKKN